MKKTILGALAVVIAVGVAGCASQGDMDAVEKKAAENRAAITAVMDWVGRIDAKYDALVVGGPGITQPPSPPCTPGADPDCWP